MDDQCRSLMVRYQEGDRSAYADFYHALEPWLRRYVGAAVPFLAPEPVIEEIFLQIHRARRSYDPRHDFADWSMAIARHVTERSARSRRRIFAQLMERLSARPVRLDH